MESGGLIRRRPGRPARLSREAIVSAGVAVVSEHGVDRLSMRRVADQLMCSPMALYRHVRDKEELLVLVLAQLAH